jgi:hypothetical protein
MSLAGSEREVDSSEEELILRLVQCFKENAQVYVDPHTQSQSLEENYQLILQEVSACGDPVVILIVLQRIEETLHRIVGTPSSLGESQRRSELRRFGYEVLNKDVQKYQRVIEKRNQPGLIARIRLGMNRMRGAK